MPLVRIFRTLYRSPVILCHLVLLPSSRAPFPLCVPCHVYVLHYGSSVTFALFSFCVLCGFPFTHHVPFSSCHALFSTITFGLYSHLPTVTQFVHILHVCTFYAGSSSYLLLLPPPLLRLPTSSYACVPTVITLSLQFVRSFLPFTFIAVDCTVQAHLLLYAHTYQFNFTFIPHYHCVHRLVRALHAHPLAVLLRWLPPHRAYLRPHCHTHVTPPFILPPPPCHA